MLIPTMVIVALIVIPYFNINIEAEGLCGCGIEQRRLRIVWIVVLVLWRFSCWCLTFGSLWFRRWWWRASCFWPRTSSPDRRISIPPLAGVEAAFLLDHDLVPDSSWSVLTAIGTFFRGPGWSWVWPWRA